MMRRFSGSAAFLGIVAMTHAAAAAEETLVGEAPFGFAWGQVAEVPRPLKVDREANLTALYYPRGWRPANGPATAEVVLVVCRDEGLQLVVWLGLPLAGQALARTRQAIRDEGVRRYGEPDPGGTADSEVWSRGRVLLASREATDGRRELVMTAFGPGYATCSRTHRTETGHPAGAHVADLIGTGGP